MATKFFDNNGIVSFDIKKRRIFLLDCTSIRLYVQELGMPRLCCFR